MLSEKQIDEAIAREYSVIGAILLNNSVYDAADLSVDDFGLLTHQIIFGVCEELIADGKVADVVTVAPKLDDLEDGTPIGKYLIHSITCAALPMSLMTVVEMIKESATLRRIEDLTQELTSNDRSAGDTISFIEDTLINIQQGIGNRPLSMSEIIDQSIAKIDSAQSGVITGVKTDLQYLDNITGGLHEDELIIIAGRPAMGKSTVASQIAMNVARHGKAALFFNLEMGSHEMLKRIYSEMMDDGIEYSKMSNRMSDNDLTKIYRAANDLKDLPLTIDDTASLSLMKLKTKTRALIRGYKKKNIDVGVIFVDYLQLMAVSKEYRGNRVQEISQITRGLKILAKELHIPVVALSQLSRGVESRENKRPMLSDLRESGSIEQDADVVIFAYRHEYYLEKEKPKENTPPYLEWQSELAKSKNSIELIVAKQRNGPTGTAHHQCDLGHAKIKQ